MQEYWTACAVDQAFIFDRIKSRGVTKENSLGNHDFGTLQHIGDKLGAEKMPLPV